MEKMCQSSAKADQKGRISQNEAGWRKEVTLARLRELEAREKKDKLISREHALWVLDCNESRSWQCRKRELNTVW
jgi:hypothetical protein